MTTRPATRPSKPPARLRLPDPPEREPDEKMTTVDHLHHPGHTHHLAQHLGDPGSTLVTGDRYIATVPDRRLPSGSVRRVPDLLIAFGVDPAAYRERNGYVIDEQGKPPDFVLEVASPSTAGEDTGPKRVDYEALGIREYWRFDETGEHHGTRLAGDRLVGGAYVPVEIEELAGGVLRGYSEALDLHLRWEDGRLGWYDPATGRHIATFDSERTRADSAEALAESERARADSAEALAESERARADSAEVRADSAEVRADSAEVRAGSAEALAESERARADSERTRADSAEARVRELEAKPRRLRGG